ncbi:MAG: ferrochelatase, partial [Acidobacteriaceae bacterium]|nr:ferrochelatase [Acidobacteriaceae bacterium]
MLVVSFGGPEKLEDVLPFLENVTRGRNILRERLLEVAEHYYHFGGKSPINDQNRDLIAALRNELDAADIKLPIYWGNRNWHPFLADALREMRADGVKNALAFMTSAYSSYSGCRQYRENIAAAQAEVGEGAPKIDKLRVFYNHPGFIEASADRIREAASQFASANGL